MISTVMEILKSISLSIKQQNPQMTKDIGHTSIDGTFLLFNLESGYHITEKALNCIS